MQSEFILFCGTASRELGGRIARLLEQKPGACVIDRFPDGEVNIHLEEPVRARDVYLVQSTCPPVDQNLVELLALADACRRAGAARVTAVVPYFGYGRGDKRNGRRAPIMGSMIANLMEAVGVGHLLAVDLHAPQIEGFFSIPVDSVTAMPALCNAVQDDLLERTVVVSPDEGRVKSATEVALRLHAPLAVLHKERRTGGACRITHVVGDVRDRPCLIVDDMISTGGTIIEAAEALLNAGAQPNLQVVATHPVFAGDAQERLKQPAIKRIVVADSIPLKKEVSPIVKVVSLAPLMAAAIRRFRAGESLADLYQQVIHSGLEDVVSHTSRAN